MIVDSAAGLLADKTLLRDQSYIDGAWVSARSEFEITDPATRKRIATVANCGAEAAEQAIQAAVARSPPGLRRRARSAQRS